jgi:GTP-binding protein LepA
VVNKIDLPAADVAATKKEIVTLLGCNEDDILAISSKTGEGVEVLLDRIIAVVPNPKIPEAPSKALIFDSLYNEFKGIVIYLRVMSGSLRKGDTIRFLANNAKAEVLEVGRFKPQMLATGVLEAGQIGYVITNIKAIDNAKVGDTITSELTGSVEPLPGYKEVKPMVYAGIFPEDGADYSQLREAILKLKLNDSALQFEPENSPVLGFGFRCGFLGLLHLEIFQERLAREFSLQIIITAPSVAYQVVLKSKAVITVTSASLLPDPSGIESISEPIATMHLLTPQPYMGGLMNYVSTMFGRLINTTFLDEQRVLLQYQIPLSSILTDFYDKIKNISSGYGSYNYEVKGYEPCDVIKLDILVAEELVPALTSLVYRSQAQEIGKKIVFQLKDVIPKKQFVIKIQAAVGGKIVASERISALRKDVTAKLYGGDVTRKRKLLEKQKKGKKRMMESGSVDIPTSAYLTILKR